MNYRTIPSWKAIGLVGALCLVLGLVSCEDGSYWDPDTKQLKADAVGRMEAPGPDVRIYEFTPQSNPNKQCVFVAGDNKAGLVCWDKK